MIAAKYKIGWDEKGQLVRLVFIGVHDLGGAKEIIAELNEFILEKSKRGKVNVLMDARDSDMGEQKVRKEWSEWPKGEVFKNKVNRAVLLGKSAFMKVAVNFLIYASGANNIRYFLDEKEALQWLKGGK